MWFEKELGALKNLCIHLGESSWAKILAPCGTWIMVLFRVFNFAMSIYDGMEDEEPASSYLRLAILGCAFVFTRRDYSTREGRRTLIF